MFSKNLTIVQIIGERATVLGPNSFSICGLLQVPKAQPVALISSPEDSQHYEEARQCVEELALYLKPLSNTRGTLQHALPFLFITLLS